MAKADTPAPLIILASTSRYRRELLQRLQLRFEVQAPQVDESPLANESARDLAMRLARDKALNVAKRFPRSVVIGSDQTADLDGQLIGKPHTHAAAIAQLESMQGRTAVFYSALAVVAADGHVLDDCVPTTVTFRNSTPKQLEQYLRTDQPYDCTGAAKIESLGIALVERVESTDPTALIGLPLISLTSLLAAAHVDVLSS